MTSYAALDVALFHGQPAAELLPITMIEPWPHNPRRSIDPAHLVELADSISKLGVLQPILVRPIGAMFSIVNGERRFRAAKRAGLDHIPAVVRRLTDAEALEMAVVENLQREEIPPLDEAEGYERLHLSHGYSIEEIADRTGKSKTYVYSRLKLTSLCAEARIYLRDGKLTPTVALLVARIPTGTRACTGDPGRGGGQREPSAITNKSGRFSRITNIAPTTLCETARHKQEELREQLSESLQSA